MGVVGRRYGNYGYHDNQEVMKVKQPSHQCHGRASPYCIRMSPVCHCTDPVCHLFMFAQFHDILYSMLVLFNVFNTCT